MLTLSQTKRINALLPGEHTIIDGKMLVCRKSKPYLSAQCCQICALHRLSCEGISCMRGMLVRKTIPNDPEPLTLPRPNDVYFTLYF